MVRAASANPDMTACMGVDVARVRSSVFAAGSALAGLGGVVAAPLLPAVIVVPALVASSSSPEPPQAATMGASIRLSFTNSLG